MVGLDNIQCPLQSRFGILEFPDPHVCHLCVTFPAQLPSPSSRGDPGIPQIRDSPGMSCLVLACGCTELPKE